MSRRSIAAVLLLTTTALLAVVPASAQACETSENFDSYLAPGSVPDTCWFTFTTTGSTLLTNTQSASPSNSISASNGADITFLLVDEPIVIGTGCSGGSPSAECAFGGSVGYNAAIRFNEIPTGVLRFGLAGCGTNTACISVDSTGNADLDLTGAATASSVANFAALSIDTWYRFALTIVIDQDVDGVGADTNDQEFALATITLLDGTGVGEAGTSGQDWTVGTNSDNWQVVNTGTTLDYWVDDLDVFGLTVAEPTPITPDGPVITTVGLRGFDVDATGSTLIARTHDAESNTEDNVRTYPANTLATPGNVLDTDCDRFHGVAAMNGYVAFLECNDGVPSDVDFLMIRGADLGAPDLPPICDGDPFCVMNINANEISPSDPDQHPSNFYEINGVDEFPFDYTRNSQTPFVPGESVYMAFALSYQDGYIGVMTYTFNKGGDDKSQTQRILLNAGSVPDHICTVQDTDGQSFMYAADSEANMKGYSVDFTIEDGVNPLDTVRVDVVQVFPGTGGTSGARGVACGDGKFAAITPTTLTVFARGSGTALYTIGNCVASATCRPDTFTSVPERGITMSGDGKWLSYIEGGSSHIVCVQVGGCPATASRDAASLGDEVATAVLPTGTFKDVQLNAQGTAMWVATDVRIQLYNALFQLTTGTDSACTPGDVGCGGSQSSTSTTGGTGGGFGGGGGILGVAADIAVYVAMGVVLTFALVGWAITGAKREREPK